MQREVSIRVLGPIDALDEEGEGVPIGGPTQRRLLGLLVAAAPDAVPVDALVEGVWEGRDPPADPHATLHTYVARLRSALGSEAVVTGTGGYGLGPVATDVGRFLDAVDRARRLSGSPGAAGSWRDALALWRGRAFEGIADLSSIQPMAARLEELRAEATEAWIDARLASGETREVIADAESAASEFPFREGFAVQRMTALARAGRTAEALRAFQGFRADLTEVGLEPSARLVELDRRIAAGDVPNAGARRTLRGYELGERLGEGAFAVVWAGTQSAVGRRVAVKQIRRELADDAAFVAQFEAEAQLVARLEHPHVVPLYDYWREPGAAYLVMRYLDGGSLANRILDGGVALDELVPMVTQVAAALDFAHAGGVVHRDIKPANILCDVGGNAYLSDFGIAIEQVERWNPEAWLSNGSPAYAAPEQLQRRAVGPPADVYSLGVTVYEALTGGLPFPAETTRAGLLRRQLEDPIPLVRSSVPSVPAAVDTVLQRATAKDPAERHDSAGRFARELAAAAGLQGPTELIRPDDRNPYKGLRAFDEADAGDFSGRDRLVGRLLDTASTHRAVLVVGASGSGKSSVVRAGLLPALRAGRAPGSEGWLITSMTPGADPFADLAQAVLAVAVDPPADVERALRAERGLARTLDRCLPDGRELLLVVDQLEELFTAASVADRTAWLDRLTDAVTEERTRLRVVATVRADFYDRPLGHLGLARLVAGSTVAVNALEADELERAIVEPARRVGVDLEPGLVARITADVADQPGALPMLQYALTELFDRRDGNTMTVDAYDGIGGIAGAIADRADALFDTGDPAERAATRSVFERLVTLGEGTEDTRRRIRRSDLAAADGVDAVLERFGAARLLTFDRDAATREQTVEVAHEALIRQWPRLRRWLDEDRERLRVLRHLDAAATAWDARGRDDGDLYRAGRLDDALSLRPDESLNPTERAFVAASVGAREAAADAERRRVSRLRRLLALVAAVAVIAAGVGVVAFAQRERADREAERANLEAARATEQSELADASASEAARRAAEAEQAALVARASAEAANRPDLALLLAAEAYDRDPGVASQAALLTALGAVPSRVSSIELGRAQQQQCAYDLGQGWLAVLAPGGLALFDAGTGTVVETSLDVSCSSAVSADRKRAAAVQRSGALAIWDVDDDVLVAETAGDANFVDAAFSPDGATIAASIGRTDTGQVERLVLLDAETAAVTGEVELPFPIEGFAWAPEGQFVFVGAPGPEVSVLVRDAPDGDELARVDGLTGGVPVWEVSADGSTLWFGDLSFTETFVDLATGDVVSSYRFRPEELHVASALDPDATRVAVTTTSGTYVVDTATGQELAGPFETGDVPIALSFVDDDTVATIQTDGTAEVVSLSGAGGAAIASIPFGRDDGFGGVAADGGIGVFTYRNDTSQFGVIDVATEAVTLVPYEDLGMPDLNSGPRAPIGASTLSGGRVAVFRADLTGLLVDATGAVIDEFDLMPDRDVEVLSPSRSGDLMMFLIADRDAGEGELGAGATELVIADMSSVELTGFSAPFGAGPGNWRPLAGGGAVVLADGRFVRYDAAGTEVASAPVDDPETTIMGFGDPNVLGRPDGTVEIWDLDEMAPVRSLAGPSGVRGAWVVHGGERILLTDGAGDSLLYDLEVDATVGWLLAQQAQNLSGATHVSPDGTHAWLAVDARLVKVPLDPDAWRDRVCELVGRELTAEEWADFVPGDEPRRDICA